MIGGGVEVYIRTQTKQTERRLGRITKTRTNADYTQTNADLIPIIQNIYFRKFYLNNNFQIENMSERLVLYELDKKIYLFREAKTPEEWQKGLMFVKKPVDYDGMIFIFPDKQIRSFWNKNTFVDLEVYWLDDDKIIGKEELPSIVKTKTVKIITSPLPVNKVVEIIK
jgi:uncharacterized membrane protein (UPF0127 family)